jgi:hypothetical protein
LTVEGKKDEEGRYVRAEPKVNDPAYKWRIQYLDTKANYTTSGLNKGRQLHINRPFYIQSKLWLERVISVAESKNLVIQSRTDAPEQQWFFDQVSKTIRSVKFRDLSIDIRGGNAYAYKTDSRWYQLWKYEEEHFINERGQVLAIQSKLDTENR